MSSVSSSSISTGDRGYRVTAPEHRVSYSAQNGARSHTASSGSGEQAAPRSPSGGSSNSGSNSAPSRSNAGSGDRSSPRNESGNADRAAARSTGAPSRDGATARRANDTSANNANGTREVPNWSRPRGDRPATDTATTRVGPQPPRDAHDRNDRNSGYGYGYDPYYYYGGGYYGGGYGFYDCYSYFYGCGYGWGAGYAYSPFGFGYGIPFGYVDPYAADPYSYGGGYGSYSNSVYGGHDQGTLKLKVKPRNAKVYVDGYYVGLVDEFDGAFQKLTLNGGRHKVEVKADGYETAEFDVLITPERTVTFAGDMKKVQ